VTWNFISRKSINVDITHRCPLECPRCQRHRQFTRHGLKVHGRDLPLKDFNKIIKKFSGINFCGQLSDPVHHPKFITMLKMVYENSNSCHVHHATGYKKMEWYIKAFQANPKACWWFGIDGTPDVSHKYRINQDGQKLFEVMRESVKHLQRKPIWQYIIFRYNEDPEMIEKAHQMASDIGAEFMLTHSSRWLGENDPYRPINPEVRIEMLNKIQ